MSLSVIKSQVGVRRQKKKEINHPLKLNGQILMKQFISYLISVFDSIETFDVRTEAQNY